MQRFEWSFGSAYKSEVKRGIFMAIRVLDFSDGFTSGSPPSASGSFALVTGTYTSATAITAGGGITSSAYSYEIQYVAGSGGAVDITANPQISAGTTNGDKITIIGTHNTNTVTLDNGTGLSLNGSCVLAAGSSITLIWSAVNTLWIEESRNDV